MKKIILITCSVLVALLVGCNNAAGMGYSRLSDKGKVNAALKKVYGEEFIVHEIDYDRWLIDKATVSPCAYPDVVFTASLGLENELSYDNYDQAFLGYLIEQELRTDLEPFFPGSYIHVSHAYADVNNNGSLDFRTMSIKEILDNSGLEYLSYGEHLFQPTCDVDIYVDKAVGTTEDYEGEYEYFSKTIADKVSKNEMLPLCVSIYMVDKDTIDRLKDYNSKDLDYDHYFYETVLGVEDYELGVISEDTSDLGNPSNMSAVFADAYPAYLDNFDEYARRRKLLESAK